MATTDDNRPASAGNVKAGIADAMAGLKSEMGGGMSGIAYTRTRTETPLHVPMR